MLTECNNCKFWDNSSSLEGLPDSGMCRARPPAMDRAGRALWPYTESDDWCGLHVSLLSERE